MRLQSLALTLGFLTAMLLSGCSASEGEEGEVHLTDNAFEFPTKSIATGAELEFENEGAKAHTVTIHKAGQPAGQVLHDKPVEHGQATIYKFAEAGTYHVWCKYHGNMTSGMAMTVTVA